MIHKPPRLPLRFFRWFCQADLHHSIEGDLLELYAFRVRSSGKRKADIRFMVDVLLLFRPGIIKSFNPSQNFQPTIMFRNNLKIAVRALWKNKASTIINLAGLTTGITSCLLIALFIQHELSYDTFQPNRKRIARVVMEYGFDGSTETQKGTFTSTKVAPVFSRTFPEVEKGIRMTDAYMIFQLHNEPVTEPNFMYTDSSFFNAFEYELLAGDVNTALNGPKKIVLTESMAKKYFGDENPLGKTLEVGSKKTLFEITGVMRDYPATSQLRFDFLASFSSIGENQEDTYFNANYTTYLLLRDEYSFASLQEKLGPFMKNEMKGTGARINFSLEHFDQVHVHSPYRAFVPNTSIRYLLILSAIALLILVIVCFTYINLSTAKSIERAKEVGIRKVSGAVKGQLFWQFIGESFVLCLLSVLVSFCLVSVFLPSFNELIGRTLTFHALLSPQILATAFGITIVVSLFAGAYPALVLSRLQPARVLKGVFKNSSSGRWLQQSLTVFQFAISVFLIISTLVIQNQLYFIQHKNVGYDRNHVVSLSIGWDHPHKTISTFKKELKRGTGILDVSRAGSTPVNIVSGYSMRQPAMPEGEIIPVNANPVDEGYIPVNGFQLISGLNFTEQQVNVTDAGPQDGSPTYYILNESAAKKLGWTPEEAVGRKMSLNSEGIVSGVIKDFHFQSLRNDIKPLVLFTSSWGGRLLVKIDGRDIPGALAFIESRWKQFMPERPFTYKFLDDDYNSLYQTELQLSKTMNLFSGIAIVLACLGLFGLSSYIIQQRMKEVGIRKVLGASLWNVLNILSGNFVRLVLVAIVIASPIAYALMKQWLDDFAYRIDIPWWAFLIAGVATMGIAVVTAGVHALRAGVENPVKNLKAE